MATSIHYLFRQLARSEITQSRSELNDWEKNRTSLCGHSLKFYIMQQIIGFADEGGTYC